MQALKALVSAERVFQPELRGRAGCVLSNNDPYWINSECLYLITVKITHMWWIYALLSAFFAAATAVLAKIGIKGIDANLATAIRTVVILLLAWAIVFFRNDQHHISGLTKQNWTFLILSGLATGLSWVFYFKALQLGKVSQVAPVDKASVAIAILLSVIFLGEPLTLKTVLAVLMIIGGTIILIFQ